MKYKTVLRASQNHRRLVCFTKPSQSGAAAYRVLLGSAETELEQQKVKKDGLGLALTAAYLLLIRCLHPAVIDLADCDSGRSAWGSVP